jgi:hypothetical protein
MRLSALRLPSFAGSESIFGDGVVVVGKTRARSAPRERFCASSLLSAPSLPGLTRQSMGSAGSQIFAVLFESFHVSMDHRVKPGGDGD